MNDAQKKIEVYRDLCLTQKEIAVKMQAGIDIAMGLLIVGAEKENEVMVSVAIKSIRQCSAVMTELIC
jgi:hypothetical protein